MGNQFYILLLLFAMLGCQTKYKVLVSINHKPSKDSILTGMGRFLHLSDIRNSKDSIVYRVWCELSQVNYVFDISSNKEEYNCNVYKYSWERLNDTSSWLFVDRYKRNIRPKSGWTFLIDYLEKNNIKSLQDMDSVIRKEIDFADGGNYFTVEISESKKYRNYHYVAPGYYKNQECINMENILFALFREFEIPVASKKL